MRPNQLLPPSKIQTPAGAYAHTTNRDWEDDSKVEEDDCSATDNDDIAEQLVYGETGKNFKVILGGGSRHFIGRSLTEHDTAGRRNDEKNLMYKLNQRNEEKIINQNILARVFFLIRTTLKPRL